ncbi:MAG TPA: site-specific integrase [Verrucomicrobia bacterium]|nr:site-specific integrase [Verrucomicrobiota bacterium]
MSWRNSRNTNGTVHIKKHEAPKRAPWPRLIKIGRTTVKIYRRKMPSGNWAYRIPSYSSGKRRFDCHPVKATQAVKADDVAIQIFTPTEMRKLLAATSNEFLPSIVLGAFAGLRSAEIKRLTWDDIRLAERHIVVGKDKSKTASRRIVPIWENCATWLAPYAGHAGAVWGGGYSQFYAEQKRTAKEAGIAWKRNGLRHSYASYRFAQTMDAGRVAGELGNSAVVVHRHYRELVTPKAGEEWFAMKPSHEASNIISAVG